MRPAPRGPSKREREVHEANGHVPYRAWCEPCIRGKGHRDAHRRSGLTGPETVSTLGIDYAYFESRESASEAEGSPAPILAGRDNSTK
eukprot:1327365-Amphidinium_carterae.1